MIYLVYESSKGRKDLVYATTEKEFALGNAQKWKEDAKEAGAKNWHYTVYEVGEFQTFYIEKINPIARY